MCKLMENNNLWRSSVTYFQFLFEIKDGELCGDK
jgi:hypothetical protein